MRSKPDGVLTDGEIQSYVDRGYLIDDHFNERCLRAAAYDLRVAANGIVTPTGELYPPSYHPDSRSFSGQLVLRPGETAELSSLETFRMPRDVAGNISIKTELARQGLLLLTGLLIDPEYGVSREIDPAKGTRFDGRLHFFVANVGSDAIVLFPGETPIAAVQFLWARGARLKRRPPSPPRAASWESGTVRSLGFIAELRTLRREHNEMRRTIGRTRENIANVLLLGYFLIAATILGLTLNNLLSVGSKPGLIHSIERAVPDSAQDKALVAVLAISLAWSINGFALLLRLRTPRLDTRRLTARDRSEREALSDLRNRRWRNFAIAFLLVPAIVIPALAWLAETVDSPVEPWIAPFVIAVAVAGYLYLLSHLWRPISEDDLRDRAAELEPTREMIENAKLDSSQ